MDVVQLVQHVMGSLQLSGQELANADINSDGLIDVLDVVALVSIILGND